MTNAFPPLGIPNADWVADSSIARRLVLTACRAGTWDPVTIEMTEFEWFDLVPVKYVVKLALSRKQPRRPKNTAEESATSLVVPRGHIEWRDGQNWVILTARRAGTQDPVTVDMTLAQWFALEPVQFAIDSEFERWRADQAYWKGEDAM